MNFSDVRGYPKDLTPLAGKRLCEFSAEDFLLHVQSLYRRPMRKKKRAAAKPAAPKRNSPPAKGLSFRINKAGKPSITCRRDFKYVTKKEIFMLSQIRSFPEDQLWILFKTKGFLITETKEEAEILRAELGGFPW